MSYAKLDDTFYDHKKTRKILKTEPAAGFLFLMAISYCSRHDTDGEIDVELVNDWVKQMPIRGKRKQELYDNLFALGLFEYKIDEASARSQETLVVVDYLEWQRSSDERRKRHDERREAGRRGGLAKAANRLAVASTASKQELEGGSSYSSSQCSTRQCNRGEEANASSLSSDAARSDGERATEDDRRLCGLLRQLAEQHNPKFKVRSGSRWLTDMRLLRERDGNAPAEIERALRWLFSNQSRGSGDFWWANVIRSPGNLREHFPTIWSQMENRAALPAQKPNAGALIAKLRAAEEAAA